MAVKKRPKTLASGRPPVSKPRERMTAQRSRTIIRTHHRLHSQLAEARKTGNCRQPRHWKLRSRKMVELPCIRQRASKDRPTTAVATRAGCWSNGWQSLTFLTARLEEDIRLR